MHNFLNYAPLLLAALPFQGVEALTIPDVLGFVKPSSNLVERTTTGTGKRGLAYSHSNYTNNWGKYWNSKSQVTWAYNWYLDECGSETDCTYNTIMDYIPMLFSDDSSLTSIWTAKATAAIKKGSTALFSFNEPDACYSGSACMSASAAATAYKKWIQPFAGKAKLGAPAVTNAASPDGLTWLESFLDECSDCTIDFINVHWYSNHYAGATYFEEYMESVKAVAGNTPVWVSEYGLTDDDPYTEAELIAFLETTMSWMDQQSWIHKYAYFMDEAGVLMGPLGKYKSNAGRTYALYQNTTTQPYIG